MPPAQLLESPAMAVAIYGSIGGGTAWNGNGNANDDRPENPFADHPTATVQTAKRASRNVISPPTPHWSRKPNGTSDARAAKTNVLKHLFSIFFHSFFWNICILSTLVNTFLVKYLGEIIWLLDYCSLTFNFACYFVYELF